MISYTLVQLSDNEDSIVGQPWERRLSQCVKDRIHALLAEVTTI